MARKRPVLDQLNIVVRDMEAAVDFYRLLGLEIPETLPEWQAHHRTADIGGEVDLVRYVLGRALRDRRGPEREGGRADEPYRSGPTVSTCPTVGLVR